MKRRSLVQAAGATALLPLATLAQDKYPSKPITWVCPYAAGGNADSRSRQVAKVMSTLLGQPILIDNKAGAGGNIGTEIIARAARRLHRGHGQFRTLGREPCAVQKTEL